MPYLTVTYQTTQARRKSKGGEEKGVEVEEKEMKTSGEENLRHVLRYFMINENGVVSRPFIGWFFSSHLSSTSTSPPPE